MAIENPGASRGRIELIQANHRMECVKMQLALIVFVATLAAMVVFSVGKLLLRRMKPSERYIPALWRIPVESPQPPETQHE